MSCVATGCVDAPHDGDNEVEDLIQSVALPSSHWPMGAFYNSETDTPIVPPDVVCKLYARVHPPNNEDQRNNFQCPCKGMDLASSIVVTSWWRWT